ncbi:MAG: SRPBCC family protein [Hungatella sp.]|nr:SRPBCC family protein [Hungatella sp.]
MTTYNMKADIRAGIHKVWEIVSAAEGYPAWRSDVEKTVTAHEKQFTTYTKDGYSTVFTVTAAEPCRRWEADVETSHVKGHWTVEFTSKGSDTEIDFTGYVTAKRLSARPVGKSVFEKTYLQKEMARFVADLENAVG